MTNNWTDIGNATLVVAMGANPSENHPACMAHINKAKAGANGHPKAKLIVIDPRKTRTADQADLYVRIRPGTDIAFINAMLNYIINNITGQAATNLAAYLNQKMSRNYIKDGNTSATVAIADCSKYTDARIIVNPARTDYVRGTVTVGADTVSNFPTFSANYDDAGVDTVYNLLKAHVAPYTLSAAAGICGCSAAQIQAVADAFIANSRISSFDPAAPTTIIHNPKNQYYRSTTMLYAMGITQHTYGSQNVKAFAVIQTFLGNMGRCGGGINALRGIHNVQGSTDMGMLYGNTTAYNYAQMSTQSTTDANAWGKYVDKLYGTKRLSGGVGGAGSYDDAYTPGNLGLQQRGWYNLMRAWFGPGLGAQYATDMPAAKAEINAIQDCYPKGNGRNHIQMFRDMAAPTASPFTKAAVVWGQNPAVTEPNQSKVRAGLKALELLVVVDTFATETAMCDRDGTTYLIPACSYVEEAGSVTNSGRALQWRERATRPKGNTKADLELLLRLAKKLSDGGAFSRIQTAWTGTALAGADVYATLYGTPYGWTPDGVTESFEAVSVTDADVWSGENVDPTGAAGSQTVSGSEAVAEKIFREYAGAQANGGTVWLYLEGYHTTLTSRGGDWRVYNRAKSRDNSDLGQTLTVAPAGYADLAAYNAVKDNNLLYKNWGYAWLVNRRVLYNNGELPWDQTDGFQGGEQCARLFVPNVDILLDYSANYRHIHRMKDMPDTCLTTVTAPHVVPGRFPAHTEPYETPREDLAALWGRNYNKTDNKSCVPSDTKWVSSTRTGDIPAGKSLANALILTSIRCVEHFQGGPTTRNNPWNVEAEPIPWIEINSVDARNAGIVDGQFVNVITARGNSTTSQVALMPGGTYTRDAGNPADNFGRGFKARVGVGIQSNQRVAAGTVAIPWHWGDQGLSTGSRANDLCIDANDANTTIPEYKACLCWIEPIV